MVEADGECKQGMDSSYKGQLGCHPLIVTMADTGEVLRLVNRSDLLREFPLIRIPRLRD